MEIIHWFGNHWSTVPSFQQYHDAHEGSPCRFLRTCFPDWVVKSAFLSLETFGLAIGIIRAQGCWCPVYFTQYILVKLGIPYIYIYIRINIHVLIYTYTKSKSHIQKALKILCYTLPSFFCPVFFQSFSNIERLRLPTLRLHWSAPWENPPRDRGRWSRRS